MFYGYQDIDLKVCTSDDMRKTGLELDKFGQRYFWYGIMYVRRISLSAGLWRGIINFLHLVAAYAPFVLFRRASI